MGNTNISHQTIFTRDNLEILEGINSNTVDLIYLDPPFNSNAEYGAPIGGKKIEKIFKDIWTLQDVDLVWWESIKEKNKALYVYLDAVDKLHTKRLKSYLIYMAVRLIEMQRILRPTGSIYLHCDQHASHYLKPLMDAIFKQKNFRNEIVWQRTTGKGLNPTKFLRNTDHIFLYSNGKKPVWNQPYIDFPKGYGDDWKNEDEYGKWQSADLTGGKGGSKEAYMPFKGVIPPAGRAWAPPRREKFPEKVQFPDDYENMSVQQKLKVLDDLGMIHWSKKTKRAGGKPSYKKYRDTLKGIYRSNLITDIPPVRGNEATKYPTQKPLDLLRMLIKAASNEGDMILDPFCGCATTCVAAQFEKRQWVGIDISPKAAELLVERLGNELYTRTYANLHEPPERDDFKEVDILPLNKQTREYLYKRQAGYCFVCYHNFIITGMAIDHKIARKHKGNNHKNNLQLLCTGCNSMKGSRPYMEAIARQQDKVGFANWERQKAKAERDITKNLKKEKD